MSITVDPVQLTAVSQPFTGDGATAVWTDPKVVHTLNIPRDVLAAVADAIVTRQRQPRPPQVVLPDGSLATMPDGSILTLGGNGEVYRDGEQLPGVAARQVVQFGTRIYAQGKVNPLWWRWTGSGWAQVTAFDPRVLVDLP